MTGAAFAPVNADAATIKAATAMPVTAPVISKFRLEAFTTDLLLKTHRPDIATRTFRTSRPVCSNEYSTISIDMLQGSPRN